MKGILSCHSPASLLNTIFYFNGRNFYLRGYQEHATLRFFLKSVASQILTVTCIMNTALKTILEELLIQLRDKIVPILATDTSRCHVAILDFYYFSKVPPLAIKSDSLFYMPLMPSGTGTTMLFDSGTPIQKCTGHRSLLAL